MAATCALLTWPTVSRAQDPTSLRIGVFAPNSRFTDAGFGYVNSLARHIANITKIPTSGKAYGNGKGFSGALGGMDFAIVDPLYICRRGFRVLATGRLGGSGRPSWGLFARGGIANVGALKGKKLAMARSGPWDTSFASRMVGGRVNVGKYFGRIIFRRDLTSAINAVKGGYADAVIAPRAMASGLRLVYASPSVPNAGFVVVRRSLPKDLVEKVARAVRSFGGAGVGGWGGATSYSCPAGRVQFKIELTRQRYVPPAGTQMIRKALQPGKGYKTSPILVHFRDE